MVQLTKTQATNSRREKKPHLANKGVQGNVGWKGHAKRARRGKGPSMTHSSKKKTVAGARNKWGGKENKTRTKKGEGECS